jgi:PST family polysaccharide transporter
MMTDFYPRLTGVANDNQECNRLINEQGEVVLSLAVPGVLATLTFASLVIHTFYSREFFPAVPALRWICLGMCFKLASWSMGFVIMAKGEQRIFFVSELLSNIAFVLFVWIAVTFFGLVGTGVGFAAMCLAHLIGTFVIVNRLSGFRPSTANLRLVQIFAPLIAVVFVAPYVISATSSLVISIAVTGFGCAYSLRHVRRLMHLATSHPDLAVSESMP